MALDRQVVRCVGEQHVRFVRPQNTSVALGVQRIAAKQVMLAKNPEVARAGHRRGPSIDGGQFVFLVEAAAVQKNVDLTHLEATDLELDLRRKFQDLGELERERLAVPCGILSNPVERQGAASATRRPTGPPG